MHSNRSAHPTWARSLSKRPWKETGIDPSEVDEVILGNVLQAADAGYAPRLASLRAGIPEEVPVIAINRQCSSGLEAINLAAQLIRTGDADVVVAGGTENMSMSPYLMRNVRWDGLRMGTANIDDSLIEGLSCPVNNYHMGVTAENVASRFEVTREDQDQLALLSHQRASQAVDSGLFEEQIVPVSVPQQRGEPRFYRP